MKAQFYLAFLGALVSATVKGQGVFGAANLNAPTRIGSMDGPLAGTNIFGQMFGGAAADSLMPVGRLDYHDNGTFFGGIVAVPGVSPYNFAYVQLMAWDSIWGTTLADVPRDQIGRTDIATVWPTTGMFPDVTYTPHFTQPAIVPIPEPSIWALGALAGCLAFLSRFACRQLRHPK